MSEAVKRCARCVSFKPAASFNKRLRSKDGLASYCRLCDRAIQAEYRAKNPGRYRAYEAGKDPGRYREYRQRNPDIVEAQQARYTAKRAIDQARYEAAVKHFNGRPQWGRHLSHILLNDHRCGWFERVSKPIAEHLAATLEQEI